jgi:hypothetical protein
MVTALLPVAVYVLEPAAAVAAKIRCPKVLPFNESVPDPGGMSNSKMPSSVPAAVESWDTMDAFPLTLLWIYLPPLLMRNVLVILNPTPPLPTPVELTRTAPLFKISASPVPVTFKPGLAVLVNGMVSRMVLPEAGVMDNLATEIVTDYTSKAAATVTRA